MTTKLELIKSNTAHNLKSGASLNTLGDHHHHQNHYNSGLIPNNGFNLVELSNLDDKERKLIAEFIHLLDKSKQLFNSLRELPQYGHKNNQWQAYFGRTFDVYTRLWKFQQEHRQILDQKYNLKRWQIGEIASKIGQLYYHYYLRTSESNYLYESFSFYQAIQTRAYYSKANKEEKPDLMVKKLRYYARYIVVCMLLKKSNQVKELIAELSRHIDDYVKIYDPEDQLEWQLVRNEINDFIQADSIVNIDNTNIVLSNRLNAAQVPLVSPNALLPSELQKQASSIPSGNQMTLQEIIIVGNCQDQIKFSELSLDMFRILQAVERETSSSTDEELNDNSISNKLKNITNSNTTKSQTGASLFAKDVNKTKENTSSTTQSIIQRENPHKYLLYKPSFSQFYTYIASAFKDLPPHGVMMLYISADSCEPHSKSQSERSFDYGGVKTNNKKENSNNVSSASNNNTNNQHISLSVTSFGSVESSHRKSATLKESHCIYPGDLYSYLRKPLFLIVDSFNSNAFHNIPNLFGQPFISLLSPINLPTIFSEQHIQQGSIFTLFLTNPLFAFCYVCDITKLTADLYAQSQNIIRNALAEIARAFYRSKSVDSSYLQFCQDDFLRVFIYRYVFCYNTLRLHRGFKGEEYYPSCQPPLPRDIIENANVEKLVINLAELLNIKQLFLDIDR